MGASFLKYFTELNQFNRDRDFLKYREQNLKNILLTLTIISVITVLGFHIVDRIIVAMYKLGSLNEMLILRIVTAFIFIINLSIALITKRNYKFFIYCFFYISAIFSTAFTYFSTTISSSYWGGLGLTLIIWFIFVPFSYRKLFMNALVSAVQYYIIFLLINYSCIKWQDVAIAGIIFICTFVVGMVVAVFNNSSAAKIYFGSKALSESEEKFRTLTETAQDSIIMVDSDGIITYWNKSSEKIFGYLADEAIGISLNELVIPPRFCCSFDNELKMYLESGESPGFDKPYELITRRKNGDELICEMKLSIFQVKSKWHAVGMFRDITERKMAETALKESEERFSIFMDNMPAAVYIKDAQGRFQYVNKYLDEFTGQKNLVGKTSFDYLSETLADQIDKTDKLTLTEQAINIQDEVIRDKDGNDHDFKTLRFIVKNRDKVNLIGGISVDITDNIKAEEKLRSINEKLSFFIQQTPLAYIEWNEKLEVTDWNPAAEKMFGYKREEVLHLHAYQIIVPADVQAQIEPVYQDLISQTGGSYSMNENITKEGKRIFCEWFNTPLKDKDGKVNGLASIVQDVTERKRIEAEREKTVAVLEKDYTSTKEQMQNYFTELQVKKNELLRLQKENLQSQFETLKNQVNPHFLFNSLNVLTSLISVDPELAEQFTGRLSKIYRYVLEYKSEDLVPISTEIEFLKSYSFLLGIRFSNKVKINININADKLNARVPPLAIQLLIENAIKHNIFTIKNPLIIDIFVDHDDYLNVANNLQVREMNIESTGVGLKNIENRYSFFTDRGTFFGKTGGQFVAKVPLL